MKIAYFDCFSGISGDMTLGALVDVGVDLGMLTAELSKLNLDAEFKLDFERAKKHHITGTRAIVRTTESGQEDDNRTAESSEGVDAHSHSRDHAHETHDHSHHDHVPSRHLSDIFAILEDSNLERATVDQSKQIFDRLAEAEAKVHNTPKDRIHLHEVSGIDSIVDIVGCVIGLNLLGIEELYASPLALGSGFVRCAHGLMPVPVPGTMELLKGVEVRQTQIRKELVTPTGAAIITTLARRFGPMPEMVIDRVGYGAGTRELEEQPNLLRICLGEKKEGSLESDRVYLIETNLDDMSPEIAGYLTELLFEKGALDVFLTSILMKKGRPATKLSLLVAPDLRESLTQVVLSETTTFGVRCHLVERSKLSRDFIEVQTRWGTVRAKRGYMDGEPIKTVPEYEDCKRIAEEQSVPFRQVYEEAMRA
ncbi:MAG: nickel pincer cofactor biosynthesis protein LarC, partial [Candidatus Poribacteria bacterium]|nr:nickel pincer cofactor biosynthesis protein LarC [Candidatus Poribacteria bacterium]